MPAGGCSSTTPVNGADTTGTINSGSTTLTLAAARDFKNGCGLEMLGAGPTSTLAAPTLSANPTSASRSGGQTVTMVFTGQILSPSFGAVGMGEAVSVTGCSVGAYNAFAEVQALTVSGGNTTVTYNVGSSANDTATSCLATFIYGSVHGVAGSTTYNYKLAKCDLNHGCSPASANLQITGANATLSKNNYNYIAYPFDTNAALWLLYSDKGLGGALTCVNASVTMAMIDIGGYNPCPPYAPTNPPVAATAQSLFTTISSGGGTTTLTLANAASSNATTQNVYHDESSFLNSCIMDANNDLNVNSTQFGGGYGCYVPQGVYGMNGPLKTASLGPNGSLNIYVAGTLNFQTQPWQILKSNYQIIGIGGGAQGGTVGQKKPMTAIKFGPNVPYGFVLGTASFSSSIKGFQMQYINGTGVFIGATNPSNGTSGVSVEDMAIVEQGASGNAPCVTIDDDNIGIWLTNVACQAPPQVGGMPCVYVTHTPSGSFVNQILRNNGVHCTFHGWKFDGPGGQAAQAAIHDISYYDSFSENLPNADIAQFQVDAQANGFNSGGWALQGVSLDHLISSDASAQATFVQMSPTAANNMSISAVEIKNSYLSGAVATCAVITNCQQYPVPNVASLGIGFALMPSGQSGVESGQSALVAGNSVGATVGSSLGIVPGTANIAASPAIDMPWIIYMPPLNANNLNSIGAGSLAAGVYCAEFTGLDANSYESQPTNVRCDTVGASADIIYDFSGPGAITSTVLFSGFNFYYCFTASGTCSPGQRFSSISTVSDGGSGRLFTFTTTAGSSAATPTLQGKAMMSWLAEDPTQPPLSCFFCVNGSSDAWPIGIGMLPTANAGYNLYTKLGVNVGGNLKVSGTGMFANINTVRYANSLTAGADCVAKLNTLDAAIGASAGEIDIDPSCGTTWTSTLTESGPRVYKFLGGGTYTIPLGTLVFSKQTLIDGVSLPSTILNFTGLSGIAMSFQGNTVSTGSYQDWSQGVRNLQMVGPAGVTGTSGYAGTGISIGATNKSTIGVLIDNVLIAGFSIGETWGDTSGNSWGTKMRHSAFYNEGTNDVVFNATNEVVNYDTVTFSPNISNGYQTACFTATANGSATFINSHFDACQFTATTGTFTFDAFTHFENVNANTTNPFVLITGTQASFNGTQFVQTRNSGSVPPEFISAAGNSRVTVSGASFFSNATMTNAILLDTNSEYHQIGLTVMGGVTTPVGNTAGWTGNAVYDNSGTVSTAATQTLSSSGTGVPQYILSRGSSSPVTGAMRLDDSLGTSGLSLLNGAFTVLQSRPSDGLVQLPQGVVIPGGSTFGVRFAEGAAPSAGAGADPCYGDSTVHAIKCNYNNATNFGLIPLLGGGYTFATGNLTTTFNSAQTTDVQDALTIGETSAATNGTLTNLLANQANAHISTASGSTATPFEAEQLGCTAATCPPLAQFESTWNNASLVGQGIVENITNTSSAAGSLLENLRVGNVTQWSVDKGGLASGAIVQASTGTQTISGADYTNSTTTPSTLFSWTLPATTVAKNYRFTCDLMWESTAATLTAPILGVNMSAAPTQISAGGAIQNTIAGNDATGYISNTTTGHQNVITGTAAGVTNTNYWAKFFGTIEGAPTAGSTFIIDAAALSSVTSTVNIRRGSGCYLN